MVTRDVRTSISSLARGYEFPRAEFSVSAAEARAYLAAVGDGNDYGGSVPPLAAVALALSSLQTAFALPEGALHTGQEVEQGAAIAAGELLEMTGRVAQRSERQGLVISVIAFEIWWARVACVRARTTIMAPGDAS